MDRMTRLAAALLCSAQLTFSDTAEAATPEEMPSGVARWQSYIADAARQFGMPEAWIRGVMRAESGGHSVLHGKPITSPKGAMGLMQIMPRTYDTLRAQYGLGSDAYDPRDNILAGAAYLRQMYERYGYPSLFAAYNAGPRRLEDFLFRGRALPRETRNYVGRIVPGGEFALSSDVTVSGMPPLTLPAPALAPVVQTGAPTHRHVLFFARTDASATVNSGG
ncbi:MAG TPA: lytic transglycosylase domain-containing protein, partial [Steroidobacteraceae bacterium]